MSAWLRAALVAAACLTVTAARADDPFDLLDINEGALHFLTAPLPAAPPRYTLHIHITPRSLTTGWVDNRQCHYRLDRVPAMQIVFGRGAVRDLRITRAEHIGRAWVDGDTVQLSDVLADAVLCLASKTRTLSHNPDGTYAWRGGPYMRRFLDGYFPLDLRLVVDYPSGLLALRSIEPEALKLNAVTAPGSVRLATRFEGRLSVTLGFAPSPHAP